MRKILAGVALVVSSILFIPSFAHASDNFVGDANTPPTSGKGTVATPIPKVWTDQKAYSSYTESLIKSGDKKIISDNLGSEFTASPDSYHAVGAVNTVGKDFSTNKDSAKAWGSSELSGVRAATELGADFPFARTSRRLHPKTGNLPTLTNKYSCATTESIIYIDTPPAEQLWKILVPSMVTYVPKIKTVAGAGRCAVLHEGDDELTPLAHQEVSFDVGYASPDINTFEINTVAGPPVMKTTTKVHCFAGSMDLGFVNPSSVASVCGKLAIERGLGSSGVVSKVVTVGTDIIDHYPRVSGSKVREMIMNQTGTDKDSFYCKDYKLSPSISGDKTGGVPLDLHGSTPITESIASPSPNVKNGCIYKRTTKNQRTSTLLNARAGMKCVVEVSYGGGKTISGQEWETPQWKYTSDYGNHLDSFTMCTDTYYQDIPDQKKGGPELFPSDRFGRYANVIVVKMDDPDLDVSGCVPQADGTCKNESIKIVKHNYSYKAIALMQRSTCASYEVKNPDGTTDRMSWARLVSSPEFTSEEVSAGKLSTAIEDLFNNHGINIYDSTYDMAGGSLLTYTMNDCAVDSINAADQYFCAQSNDTVDSNNVDLASNYGKVSKYHGTIPFEDAELKNRSHMDKKYSHNYSTPTENNQPYVSVNGITDKEIDTQKESTFNKGLTITRSNEVSWLKFPRPVIQTTSSNKNMENGGKVSNMRITNTFALLKVGSTPLVDTPDSDEEFGPLEDGKIPHSRFDRNDVENPWIPSVKEDRQNGYYSSNGGQIVRNGIARSNYSDSADKLDFRLYSPKDGLPLTEIQEPGQQKSYAYKPWKDYYVYDFKEFTPYFGVSATWNSQRDKPAYLAPAYQISADFPVYFERLAGIRTYGTATNSWQPTIIKNATLTCVGPSTPITVLKSTN